MPGALPENPGNSGALPEIRQPSCVAIPPSGFASELMWHEFGFSLLCRFHVEGGNDGKS